MTAAGLDGIRDFSRGRLESCFGSGAAPACRGLGSAGTKAEQGEQERYPGILDIAVDRSIPPELMFRHTVKTAYWILTFACGIWFLGFLISIPLFIFFYLISEAKARKFIRPDCRWVDVFVRLGVVRPEDAPCLARSGALHATPILVHAMTAFALLIDFGFSCAALPDVGLKDPELDVGIMRAGNRHHDFCGKAPHRLRGCVEEIRRWARSCGWSVFYRSRATKSCPSNKRFL